MFLFVPSSSAQTAFHLTTVSYHIDRTPGGGTEPPNEFNPGLGMDWRVGQGAVHLGGYYNTVRAVTLYAGYERSIFDDRQVRVGGVAGIVTGYPIIEVMDGVSILPGILPFVEVGRKVVRPRLYAIPFRGGVLAVQFRIRVPR